MPYLMLQTNAGAPDTLIEDVGVTVPGSGATATYTEISWLRRFQQSSRLRILATDDVYGVNSSTLVLYDLAGQPVPQGFIDTFLSQVLEDIPGKHERGRAPNHDFVYVARTLTPNALEADPVWQIYRFDVRMKIRTFADGNANFDNVWDSTGGAGTPTYETLSYS